MEKSALIYSILLPWDKIQMSNDQGSSGYLLQYNIYLYVYIYIYLYGG